MVPILANAGIGIQAFADRRHMPGLAAYPVTIMFIAHVVYIRLPRTQEVVVFPRRALEK